MKLFKLFVALGGVSLLMACGGGGGDCTFGALACGSSNGSGSVASTGNVAPVAHAGSNQTVVMGNDVTLNGSASSDANNDKLTYAWSMISAPAGFKLTANEVRDENATAVKPTFKPTMAGVYVFGLVVTDTKNLSSQKEVVTVTVTAENLAPVANAGVDQSVTINTQVTLDGSASSDPNRDLVKHTWAWVSQPAGSNVTFDSATSPKPKFTPVLDGAYVASLVVSDDKLNSAPDYVTVTVSRANAAPMASAGTDQNVTTGTTVKLNGLASTDPNADRLFYNWTLNKPSGSAATLLLTDPSQPTFVADVSGDYVASLSVSDGKLDSVAVSTVRVTAATLNSAPMAAGTVSPSTVSLASLPAARLVTLDGSGSTDANFDRLTYAWSLSSVPTGSTATLTVDPTNRAKSTFTPTVAGVYVATLVVSDGKVYSAPVFVSMTVVAANAAPVANAGTNQSVVTGSPVTLNGLSSSDANGDPLNYFWTLNKPVGSNATLSLTVPSQPTFTADVSGDYVATLTVNDTKVDSANLSTVRVTATAANIVPVASGVASPTTVSLAALPAAKLVTLDGSGSTDGNYERMTYSWVLSTVPTGSTATLTVDPTNAAKSTFTPTAVGVYVATLIVTDVRGASSPPITVVITVTL